MFFFQKENKVILIHYGVYLSVLCRSMSYIISNDILLSEPEFKNILDCGHYMYLFPMGYDTGVSRGSVGCPLVNAFRLRSRLCFGVSNYFSSIGMTSSTKTSILIVVTRLCLLLQDDNSAK